MKKTLLLLIANLFVVAVFGQEPLDPKKDLEELSLQYNLANKIFETEKTKLKELKNKIDYLSDSETLLQDLKKQLLSTKKTVAILDSIYDVAENYKVFYLNKDNGKTKDFKATLDSYFQHNKPNLKIREEVKETKTYLYFGKDKVIDENGKIFNDKTANTILKEVLSVDSKSYLGDFIIPQNKQAITLYKYKRDCDVYSLKYSQTKKTVYFKEIRIHLHEGALYDIKIIVTDSLNNELLFENKTPVSLLRYTSIAANNFISYKTTISNNKNRALGEEYENFRIRLSDALMYIANAGENYVPDNLTLIFPTKTKGIPDNINHSLKYKVNQQTSLQNIVALRTYTDFLGLFSETPNGIVQLEGKASFFIAPFNIPNTSLYLFKKITPSVNFSRLEKEDRYIDNLEVLNDSTQMVKSSLKVLEKSYLQMGVKLDLLSFKFKKEFPFETSLYSKVNYAIADIRKTDSISVNYKSLGLGGGVQFEFKRYNNFGFIISSELTKQNIDEFNVINGIQNPKSFWVFKNEAEIYYSPGKSKNQSIFLRLRTFNNSTKDNNDAFYQLQFGYSFSIGVNKLKH